MDLKGAEIRNIIDLCVDIRGNEKVPLSINIPYYQRPYKWTETEVANLISDFFKNKSENQESQYFVGSVVLVKNARGTKRHDVIDGQQRITTVYLMNYLRFLLLRSYIQELLSSRRNIRESILTEFAESYGHLLGTKHLNDIKKINDDILNAMDMVNDVGEDERQHIYDKLLVEFEETVSLPQKDLSDMKEYYYQYIKMLKGFLEKDCLALEYSRETFNKKLKESLSRVVVLVSKDRNPDIHIEVEETEDPILMQYAKTVKCQFECIYNHVKDIAKNPLDMVKCMIDAISEMVQNINFCMIMTGNERDAYTLFEVLNDRALKIDDLDLIKNLYYKEYCTKSNDDEEDIDKGIEELDEIWGEEIFTRDLPDTKIKMISYLGTIYLTADESIFMNKVEKYRETLEKKYFDCCYDKQTNPYTYSDVLRDVRIYQMVKIIIKGFELPVNNAVPMAIKAECNTQRSITYKTFHLLNALGANGVIPALINIIIKKYFLYCEERNTIVEMDGFQDYVKRIAEDANHTEEEFKDIHYWSHIMWKASIYSDGYNMPREIAKEIVSKVNIMQYDIDSVHISTDQMAKMQEQFKKWTDNWIYERSGKVDLKIKILFINLFRTSKSNNGLKICPSVYTFTTEKLQLDHMEAKNPNPACLEKYFSPSDSNEEREKYTNSLGNFMILDSNDNNDKDNKPLKDALCYYDNMCPNHWLIQEIKDMLEDDEYSKIVNISNMEYRVPNEAFFNERKKRLQKYFKMILSRNLTETEMATS